MAIRLEQNSKALFDAVRHVAENTFGVPVHVGPIEGEFPGYSADGYVDGFYNCDDHAITVNERSVRRVLTLLHELTHAIDPAIPHRAPGPWIRNRAEYRDAIRRLDADDLVAESTAAILALTLNIEVDCWCSLRHHLARARQAGINVTDLFSRICPLVMTLYSAITGAALDTESLMRIDLERALQCRPALHV